MLPSAIDERLIKIVGSMVVGMERTEPSPKVQFVMPVCMLENMCQRF